MAMMIIGLFLWVFLHLFKRVSPRVRNDLGVIFGDDIPKGTLAILIIVGLLMIIFGYLRAASIPVYHPPIWGHVVSNALMFIALVFAGASWAKGVLYAHIRHPLLSAIALWAWAHLLANGDLASVILFTTLGLWALVQMLFIFLQDDVWHPPQKATIKRDLVIIAVIVVIYLAIVWIHVHLGHNPFAEVRP